VSTQEAWDIFFHTGNIIDYLLYLKIKRFENNSK